MCVVFSWVRSRRAVFVQRRIIRISSVLIVLSTSMCYFHGICLMGVNAGCRTSRSGSSRSRRSNSSNSSNNSNRSSSSSRSNNRVSGILIRIRVAIVRNCIRIAIRFRVKVRNLSLVYCIARLLRPLFVVLLLCFLLLVIASLFFFILVVIRCCCFFWLPFRFGEVSPCP